jgi:hypothetical protein
MSKEEEMVLKLIGTNKIYGGCNFSNSDVLPDIGIIKYCEGVRQNPQGKINAFLTASGGGLEQYFHETTDKIADIKVETEKPGQYSITIGALNLRDKLPDDPLQHAVINRLKSIGFNCPTLQSCTTKEPLNETDLRRAALYLSSLHQAYNVAESCVPKAEQFAFNIATQLAPKADAFKNIAHPHYKAEWDNEVCSKGAQPKPEAAPAAPEKEPEEIPTVEVPVTKYSYGLVAETAGGKHDKAGFNIGACASLTKQSPTLAKTAYCLGIPKFAQYSGQKPTPIKGTEAQLYAAGEGYHNIPGIKAPVIFNSTGKTLILTLPLQLQHPIVKKYLVDKLSFTPMKDGWTFQKNNYFSSMFKAAHFLSQLTYFGDLDEECKLKAAEKAIITAGQGQHSYIFPYALEDWNKFCKVEAPEPKKKTFKDLAEFKTFLLGTFQHAPNAVFTMNDLKNAITAAGYEIPIQDSINEAIIALVVKDAAIIGIAPNQWTLGGEKKKPLNEFSGPELKEMVDFICSAKKAGNTIGQVQGLFYEAYQTPTTGDTNTWIVHQFDKCDEQPSVQQTKIDKAITEHVNENAKLNAEWEAKSSDWKKAASEKDAYKKLPKLSQEILHNIMDIYLLTGQKENKSYDQILKELQKDVIALYPKLTPLMVKLQLDLEKKVKINLGLLPECDEQKCELPHSKYESWSPENQAAIKDYAKGLAKEKGDIYGVIDEVIKKYGLEYTEALGDMIKSLPAEIAHDEHPLHLTDLPDEKLNEVQDMLASAIEAGTNIETAKQAVIEMVPATIQKDKAFYDWIEEQWGEEPITIYEAVKNIFELNPGSLFAEADIWSHLTDLYPDDAPKWTKSQVSDTISTLIDEEVIYYNEENNAWGLEKIPGKKPVATVNEMMAMAMNLLKSAPDNKMSYKNIFNHIAEKYTFAETELSSAMNELVEDGKVKDVGKTSYQLVAFHPFTPKSGISDEKIISLLNSAPLKEYTASDIAALFKSDDIISVGHQLQQLAKEDKIAWFEKTGTLYFEAKKVKAKKSKKEKWIKASPLLKAQILQYLSGYPGKMVPFDKIVAISAYAEGDSTILPTEEHIKQAVEELVQEGNLLWNIIQNEYEYNVGETIKEPKTVEFKLNQDIKDFFSKQPNTYITWGTLYSTFKYATPDTIQDVVKELKDEGFIEEPQEDMFALKEKEETELHPWSEIGKIQQEKFAEKIVFENVTGWDELKDAAVAFGIIPDEDELPSVTDLTEMYAASHHKQEAEPEEETIPTLDLSEQQAVVLDIINSAGDDFDWTIDYILDEWEDHSDAYKPDESEMETILKQLAADGKIDYDEESYTAHSHMTVVKLKGKNVLVPKEAEETHYSDLNPPLQNQLNEALKALKDAAPDGQEGTVDLSLLAEQYGIVQDQSLYDAYNKIPKEHKKKDVHQLIASEFVAIDKYIIDLASEGKSPEEIIDAVAEKFNLVKSNSMMNYVGDEYDKYQKESGEIPEPGEKSTDEVYQEAMQSFYDMGMTPSAVNKIFEGTIGNAKIKYIAKQLIKSGKGAPVPSPKKDFNTMPGWVKKKIQFIGQQMLVSGESKESTAEYISTNFNLTDDSVKEVIVNLRGGAVSEFQEAVKAMKYLGIGEELGGCTVENGGVNQLQPSTVAYCQGVGKPSTTQPGEAPTKAAIQINGTEVYHITHTQSMIVKTPLENDKTSLTYHTSLDNQDYKQRLDFVEKFLGEMKFHCEKPTIEGESAVMNCDYRLPEGGKISINDQANLRKAALFLSSIDKIPSLSKKCIPVALEYAKNHAIAVSKVDKPWAVNVFPESVPDWASLVCSKVKK